MGKRGRDAERSRGDRKQANDPKPGSGKQFKRAAKIERVRRQQGR